MTGDGSGDSEGMAVIREVGGGNRNGDGEADNCDKGDVGNDDVD